MVLCHTLAPTHAPSSFSSPVPRVISSYLTPPGFQSTAITAYKSEGESAEFSFPLNFAEENGWGELMWKAEKDSFFQPWISFSIKNKEVSVQKSTKDLKLQLKETLPLTLKIPQVSLQFAGSGNLTLTLDKGTLHQEVNLVVMKGKGVG
jgi:CD4 antigen